MTHDNGCPQRSEHSDAAKRIADAHNLHRVAGGYDVIGHWIACKLADGTADATLYDSRRDAITHQLHESLCTYIQIQPSSMSVCAAEVMLTMARRAYDNGMRMADPDDAKRERIRRLTWEDQKAALRGNGMSGLTLPRN